MYPDPNQQQPTQPSVPPAYPIDYLNQIAPQSQKPSLNKKFLFMVGGGLALALVVLVLMLSSGGGPTEKMQIMAARLTALHDISDKTQKNLKSSQLRSINSNLTLQLTNATRDMAEPLKNNGVDVKKIDKNITEAESGEELTKKLEDARLNATLDRTYAREMSYQLDTVAALMKEIYNKTGSTSLKDYLLATDKNLQPIKKQLAEFNAE